MSTRTPWVSLVVSLATAACSSADDATLALPTGGNSTEASSSSSNVGAAGAGGGSDGAGGAGTGGASPSVHCAPDAVDTVADGANAWLVKTAHYSLRAEADQATAEDYARILEASWGEFEDYFHVAPALGAGDRLDVRFYASFDAWSAGLLDDGFMAPKEAGGVFEPSSRRAYLYDQHNPYFNQMLLVHEATHQFHLLGRAKDRNLPFWYVEGIAEYLGRQDWDGHCVKLGSVPIMNWDDMPSAALDVANSSGLDVPSIVSGSGSPSRAESWATVRFFEEGDEKAHRAAFDAFREAFDTGIVDAAHSFDTLVGSPAGFVDPLKLWLPSSQQPMEPVFTEWVHRAPHAVLAYSPGVFSLAVMKGDVSHFETKFDVPIAASWKVGAVLGYDDASNYLGVVVDQGGSLASFTATKGKAYWGSVGTAPASVDGKLGTLAVDFIGGGKAKLTVNGKPVELDIGFAPRAGLSLNDTRVLFHDIAWQ